MDHAETLRVLASLAGVVALMLALAWVARRTGFGLRARPSQTVKVLSMQSLGQARASLALVEVEGTRLLLGGTATQVNLLHTLPVADAAQPGASFADTLKQVAG